MIRAALVVASLIMPASFVPGGLPSDSKQASNMTLQQKRAAVRPLVSSATECIARKVSTDPRFPTMAAAGDVNDLIVASMPNCLDAVRTMIDAYDRMFGDGTGESFFMGPYLDGLPAAVDKWVHGAP